ncbi:phosphoribosylanthranilate isomerase [Metallosphaera hakonensis]|uniref:N-(5'-phosphoribosyl)anthranilate isomerase n=1 Tax=Metallosphaera hakonensis JCM 8857 = DSM 7519 TaxID=1293036 RepID=A0A2U9IVF1_9CREN|nr:phosphoribosylanthranilate isomerase [Metallosphaera hakonensis]AWR99998.1 phosphoribosylanthranilate isomerase [Metallosphaera hakonensis JCM 8857 = DSM 7519]
MTKVKICGISTLDDALEISKMGVDMLGFLVDPVSPRYVKPEFINMVKSNVPSTLVSVNVVRPIEEMLTINSDLIQVHRVLKDDELERIRSSSNRFILYVPSSESYLSYLRKVLDVTHMVLLDLEKKSDRVNFQFLAKVLKDYPGLGVGGGITPENVGQFLELDPGWLDVSRGVEDFPGKKNLYKVRKLLEAIR